MLNNIVIKSDVSCVNELEKNQDSFIINKNVDHLITVKEESIINESVFFCVNNDNIKSSIEQGFVMLNLEDTMEKNNFNNVNLMRFVKVYIHKNIKNLYAYSPVDNNDCYYYNLYSILKKMIRELLNNKLDISKNNKFTSRFIVYLMCFDLIKNRIDNQFEYTSYQAGNLEHKLEKAIIFYLSGNKSLNEQNYNEACNKIVNKYDPKLKEMLQTNISISGVDNCEDDLDHSDQENKSIWSYVFVLLGIGSSGAAVIMNNNRKKNKNNKKYAKKITVKLKKQNAANSK